MKQIEIDIDVYRCIESARIDFEETHNYILRRLLEIDPKTFHSKGDVGIKGISISKSNLKVTEMNARDWIYGGAKLPEGTKLRKWSGKQKHRAEIQNGSIFINEHHYQSPSAAAMAINGGKNVNGWVFWEYFDDITTQWIKLSHLRENRSEDVQTKNNSKEDTDVDIRRGDNLFINNLSEPLKDIGEKFLSAIREFHKGGLEYHPKSRKYVEQPNFYTIIIQSRDKSLRITVFGNPQEFNSSALQIKSDMSGYSAFKIKDSAQLLEAIEVIKKAKYLKEHK